MTKGKVIGAQSKTYRHMRYCVRGEDGVSSKHARGKEKEGLTTTTSAHTTQEMVQTRHVSRNFRWKS